MAGGRLGGGGRVEGRSAGGARNEREGDEPRACKPSAACFLGF